MFFFVIVLAVWIAAIAVYWVLSNMLRTQDFDRMKKRLVGGAKKKAKTEAPTAALLSTPNLKGGSVVMRVMHRYKLVDRVQTMIDQSGLKWTVAYFANLSLGLFVGGFLVCYYMATSQFQNMAVFAGLAAAAGPTVYLIRERKARLRRFEEQFPEALEFISRSMRAGHAFSVSLEMIHKEFQEPLGGEFKRAFEEHNLGLPLDTALEKLGARVGSMDVNFFISAVVLQKRTGGNLAEILDKLAFIIRERFKLRGKIRAISAHGRMTGMALTCIPLGVAILMFYTNPDYVKFFFTDDVGNLMLGAMITLEIIGYAIIQKIVKIEV